MKKNLFLVLTGCLLAAGLSCTNDKTSVLYNFDNIPDRVWAGEDFWTVPLEDWQVRDGRVECRSVIQQATFSVLPIVLKDGNDMFKVSFEMGLLNKGSGNGASGVIIGSEAPEEKDVRSAVYFGKGIRMGVDTKGFAFIEEQIRKLPSGFDFSKFKLEATGSKDADGYKVRMKVLDLAGNKIAELSVKPEKPVTGIIQLVNNFRNAGSSDNGPSFWYDNLSLEGKKFENQPDNSFGPVLWTMYTLSSNTLKMTAQLPPLGSDENQEATLEVKESDGWKTLQSMKMDPSARTVTWKIQDWEMSTAKSYRILFSYINSLGKTDVDEYTGEIQREPDNGALRFGALTCQFHNGFPYSPLVKNLGLSKPDLLYFSGDQIYEQNGGYPIKRYPEDTAILNYLGKWYMFGWAFGDLMRNIPTICTPDDHDVYHGNLWGEEGMLADVQEQIKDGVNIGGINQGFAQTVKFVNVVNRTQCEHLPDPYDSTPIKQGMSVFYTTLNYGRISFAIISDRIFKSGPSRVASWDTRADHLLKPLKDPSIIDKPELEMLGKRQELFLEEWIRDWKNVDMKVLLSQTLFTNVATHHGSWDGYLFGDMDSNGWPKSGRDRGISIIRKGFVFHVAGDQHVPSIVQYGLDNYRDAGWCYVTPAIAVGYSRWFRPDELNIPVRNRPEHGFPNTGEYKDAFGNLNYVYAIGNPDNFKAVNNRYQLAQIKSSGYGMVIFDLKNRNITMESWRFLADMSATDPNNQHPGWPFTISQFDNYGRKPVAWLPTIKIKGDPDPVVEIINQSKGELEYSVRIKGNDFSPKVFSNDLFTIRAGYPEKDKWKVIENVKPIPEQNQKDIEIAF